MIKLLQGLLALLLLAAPLARAQETALPPPPPLDPAAVRSVMRHAVEDVIRPGYADLARDAEAMKDRMERLCAAPSPEGLTAARDGFVTLTDAWARIEIVRIGPALEDSRFERILFYPDRKGLGLRQIQALLRDEDPAATQLSSLADKSVAVQGLGALDYLLYGEGSDSTATEAGAYRCRFAQAVAANVARVSTALSDGWSAPDGIGSAMIGFGPESPLFRTPDEAATALLGILVHGAEAVRDQRIESFYRGPDRQSFPRQALFWRSERTFPMIAGNLEGLRALFDGSQIATLLPSDPLGTADSIDFLLSNMARTARGMEPQAEAVLADPAQRQRLDYLLLSGKDLIQRLDGELGGAIGLSAGFSFQDGD